MQIRKYILLMLSCYSMISAKNDYSVVDINTNNVKLLSSQTMRFCHISFVMIKGEKYLVKQKRFLYKLLGAARDGLTAYVAEPLGIAHRVDIIPPNKKFPGKYYIEWPATIHTVAPGRVMRELKGEKFPYSHIKMQQGDVGITRYMIGSMASHIQLAIIAALDTFLCNHDRHKGNLFYQMSTDTFCAIDMDSSYKYNLAELSYKTLKKILKDFSTYSSQEKKALIQYRKTLKFLLNTYSLQHMLDKYDYFLKQAGFVIGSDFYTEKLQKIVAGNKKVMIESYPYIQKIVALLDDFIDRVKQEHYDLDQQASEIFIRKTAEKSLV